MERAVIVGQNQIATSADANRFGTFARESLDHVVVDAVTDVKKFTGFPVAQTGPAEVTVGAGRLYGAAGAVYFRSDEGGVVIDLINMLPAVTKRIVAIVAVGQLVDTVTEARTFVTDVETRATEARVVATQSMRRANIDRVGGQESADPLKPAVDAAALVVAWVTLGTTGIVSIERATANVLYNLPKAQADIGGLSLWREQAGTRLDTLGTDLTSLRARVAGTASKTVFAEMARDVAQIKDMLRLPDTYSSWGADHFLDLSESDPEHASFLCKVEEGIRFAFAQQRIAQLQLQNQYDERVIVASNFALPAYTEVPRISIEGRGSEVSISQYQYQTTQIVQKTRSRTRIRYGNFNTVCTNSAWWNSGRYDVVSGIFLIGNETWIVDEASRANAASHVGTVRVQQFFEDTYDEVYWDSIEVTEGVNGAVVAQTFLNSQDGYLTSIELPFTRVAATGDVTVLVTETENGAPNYGAVIAKATIAAASLKVYPMLTKAVFAPTFLQKGRYAIVVITSGAHFMALVHDNKFAEGSFFQSTDGAWFQGDLLKDIPFRANFAKFVSPRVEVQLAPLELENGIATVDFIFESARPDGTNIVFEIQHNGVWKPIQAGASTAPFSGLPALVPLRVVLIGTTDVMPGFGLGPKSQVTTGRPRTDFTHISEARIMPAEVNSVEIEVRVEGWNEGHHTIGCSILRGVGYATVETPDTTTVIEPIEDENARILKYVFNLGAETTSYKIKLTGTTDSALSTYHVSERIDIAFA